MKGKRINITDPVRKGIFCFLFAVVFLSAGCEEKVKPGDAQVKRPFVSGVSVVAVSPFLVDEYYEATGTIRAASSSYVAGRMMGTVTSLLVREGDRVHAGQALMTIDDRDVREKVKAAEAGHQEALRALESAKQNRELTDITYQRYKKMYEEKAISRQEMDQFSTQMRVAALEYERVQETVKRTAAGLAEANVYLGFTKVTAPITGTVTEKKIDVGSMAVPGAPLLTVEDTSSFNAEINVDESMAGAFKTGSLVPVSIESLDSRLTGKITQILPSIDSMSRTFRVKVSLSGAGLRSGLYAKVKIPQKKKEVIAAPTSAIVEKGQLTGLYTVDDNGIITYRLVRTGKNYGENREILSGLKPGDRIIVRGMEKAVDGGVLEKK